MNREKEDELPMMQVGFIDSICMPIYEVIIEMIISCCLSVFFKSHSLFQAFAVLSPKLIPLVDGVRNNKDEWLRLGSGSHRNQHQDQSMNGNSRNEHRARKVSNGRAHTASCSDTARNCNGSFYSEEERNNHNNINNNNNNNASDSQLKCKNCCPDDENIRGRRVSREESRGGERQEAVGSENGDTMKCTVCRSNSSGFRKSTTNGDRAEGSMAVNCTSTSISSSTSTITSTSSSSNNNNLNINNNNMGHPVAETPVVGEQEEQQQQMDRMSTSSEATPKIVGKVGNLDSTQLLLSANINHNHHEQQLQEDDGDSGGAAAEVGSKSVEWRGSGEEQRQALLANNNNVASRLSNEDEMENPEQSTPVPTVTNTSTTKTSCRRRKSGSVNFCEPSTENRRRKSVSVATTGN